MVDILIPKLQNTQNMEKMLSSIDESKGGQRKKVLKLRKKGDESNNSFRKTSYKKNSISSIQNNRNSVHNINYQSRMQGKYFQNRVLSANESEIKKPSIIQIQYPNSSVHFKKYRDESSSICK